MDDDTLIEAETAEELVRQLHAHSQAPTDIQQVWMEQTAFRTWQMTGTPVRWGTAADFIDDMIAAGLLRKDDDSFTKHEEWFGDETGNEGE